MKLNCKYCKEDFEAERSDARFCSSTCKFRNWKENKSKKNKNIQIVKDSLQSTLKGVIDGKEELDKENQVTSESIKDNNTNKNSDNTPDYFTYEAETKQYKELKMQLEKLQKDKTNHDRKIQEVKNKIDSLIKDEGFKNHFTVGLGILADPSFKKPAYNVLGALGGFLLDKAFEEPEEKKIQRIKKEVSLKSQQIRDLNISQTFIIEKINVLKEKMLSVKKYEIVKVVFPSFSKPKQLQQLEGNKENKAVLEKNVSSNEQHKIYSDSKENKHLINVSDNNTNILQTFNSNSQNNSNDKIISSRELVKLNYKALNFQGKWNEFIGQPSITFHCAIHGKAGEGKSTFAIQFANYLADNFGKVVYISGEEGFSKTIKDKFVNNNAMSQNLYVADLRNYNDIIKEIGVDDFHFIFIDSLSNMRIDGDNLKQLFERYKNSAIIVICQATKDGKMRGSYEIIHDVDIEIIVKEGLAETNKNRFKEKHKEFKVF